MQAKRTLAALRKLKGVRQFLTVHVDTAAEAAAAAEAGVEMFTFEVDDRLDAVRAAAPGVFIQAGYPQGHMTSEEIAIRDGFAAMERGVDAIYFAGSLRIVEAMAKEGIPVCGHVGYVPRWGTWTGVRAVGKTAEEALAVYQRAKDLENAGAVFVEMELVPVELADFITRNTSMITEGMGCGAVCDTQYLFSCDLLGTHTGHYPRHSKKYADFVTLEGELHAKRVEAFRAFSADVNAGAYPEAAHEIRMPEAALEDFMTRATRTGS
ncbi:3-methyl-2-oxobutanoate hydroxymethyltransferase [Oceanicola sp. 502str15]|uniref:3-methyl-2-oxobutanoate hydroxymethyltransferase n=1 Tax=Oceanicola sp. 502str15 TaxID=2696061 RepID=UPI0020958B25|nr:3-methyl-2-oxobutanoate hydroxymethyltransferase [Oceanicola sp. 502str15]MCO6385347.1 3-methyl-2-oxobutanoate hydroxymethyltransferase [Oceanicola sp. 502str15]